MKTVAVTDQKERIPGLAAGRVAAAVVCFAIMIAGPALTITVVGAVAGISLIIFYFRLMVRSLI